MFAQPEASSWGVSSEEPVRDRPLLPQEVVEGTLQQKVHRGLLGGVITETGLAVLRQPVLVPPERDSPQ